MSRKALSKGTRFDVFRRDHFTCQYCGAQPPGIVLVIDHIHPVAAGGGNEIENLTTACEACNSGKSAKILSKIPIRPDADMMVLEAQQEIAELRRFQEVKAQLSAARAETIKWIQLQWQEATGETIDWVPGGKIIDELLNRYGVEIAHDAAIVVARKIFNGSMSTRGDNWLKYLRGTAKRMGEENG